MDGFEAPTTKFVSRGVTHVLSMKTSIKADTGDGTTNPPAERAGWGGDGAEDGTLRGFLAEAVKQHFTRRLDRVVDVDFRSPEPAEADAVAEFQLNLGRQNELELAACPTVRSPGRRGPARFPGSGAGAMQLLSRQRGRQFSVDRQQPQLRHRNTRHLAVDARHLQWRTIERWRLRGRGLSQPDLESNAFGNGTFSPPPLIEAADTAPFFHDNLKILSGGSQDLEDAIVFYSRNDFKLSPGAQETTDFFGTEPDLQSQDAGVIVLFLDTLNGALNMDIARQRLNAALTLVQRFGNTGVDVQKKLMELARVEIDDAIEVLSDPGDVLYPIAIDRLNGARDEINQGIAASTSGGRLNRIDNALSRVINARDQIGDNVTFQLGQGNLMF